MGWISKLEEFTINVYSINQSWWGVFCIWINPGSLFTIWLIILQFLVEMHWKLMNIVLFDYTWSANLLSVDKIFSPILLFVWLKVISKFVFNYSHTFIFTNKERTKVSLKVILEFLWVQYYKDCLSLWNFSSFYILIQMSLFWVILSCFFQNFCNRLNFRSFLINNAHFEVLLKSFKLLDISINTVLIMLPQLCISVLKRRICFIYSLRIDLLFGDYIDPVFCQII